jgi:hypothetical protein
VSRTQATQDPVVVSQTLPPPHPPPARQVATHWWRIGSQVAVGAAQSASVAHSTQAPVAGLQTLPPGQAAAGEQATQRPLATSQRGVEPAHASSVWQGITARVSAAASIAPPPPAPLFPPPAPLLPPLFPPFPSTGPASPPVSPRTAVVVEDASLPQPAISPAAHPRINQAARSARNRNMLPRPQKAQKQTRS